MSPDVFLQCESAGCRLRFPGPSGTSCPACRSPARVTGARYANAIARDSAVEGSRLHVVLDNLRSVHNVGSIVRTAEAVGCRHIYVCGITAPLDHPKVAKTALGAQREVAWSYHRDAARCVSEMCARGIAVWALESTDTAQSLFREQPHGSGEIAIVVGNEVTGIDPAVLSAATRTVTLPMAGDKESLNVSVAFGIASYYIARTLA